MILRSSIVLLSVLHGAIAQLFDEDFLSFVTLPNTRALKYDVRYQDRARISPGYWFVAPYLQMEPEPPTNLYEQYQIGPYIYDGEGVLIWAGSAMFQNRNTFDFKVVGSLGKPHLSMVSQHAWDSHIDNGHGVILTNEYDIVAKLPMRKDLGAFDIHEFNILENGETALVTVYRSHEMTLDDFDRQEERTAVLTGGFAELNLTTAEVINEWDSYNQIPLSHTLHYTAHSPVEERPGWDYVHVNSVDKNSNGDYILSMRFTNTIYMISGRDGSIMWRLGGTARPTDFAQDFNFSKQHDVKFIASNETHHIISFLNNASDELKADEETSSALVVELDTGANPMTARVVRRYNRPDHGLTRLRGNAQLLPNNHMFVGWSERGYISEFAPEGDLLFSANFLSSRFSSYRAYKFEFTGRPSSPPDVVANVWGTDETHLITTIYVSWNGATDVVGWKFYAQSSEGDSPVCIGNASKTGFETMYMASGFLDWVTAEAIDRDGHVLGTSRVHRTNAPDWNGAWFKGHEAPAPHDPSISYDTSNEPTTGHRASSGADSVVDNLIDEFAPSSSEAKQALDIASETYGLVCIISALLASIVIACIACAIAVGYRTLRSPPARPYHKVPPNETLSEEQHQFCDE